MVMNSDTQRDAATHEIFGFVAIGFLADTTGLCQQVKHVVVYNADAHEAPEGTFHEHYAVLVMSGDFAGSENWISPSRN